ncbi:hypothetical protein Hanom_Chr07g00613951 [Helianthus anomalus]
MSVSSRRGGGDLDFLWRRRGGDMSSAFGSGEGVSQRTLRLRGGDMSESTTDVEGSCSCLGDDMSVMSLWALCLRGGEISRFESSAVEFLAFSDTETQPLPSSEMEPKGRRALICSNLFIRLTSISSSTCGFSSSV